MICETCGGELDLAADKLSGKCPYCRNTYYFKEEKSESLILALNRAVGHRLACDFHEAMKEYKLVLDKVPNDAEAHFGMLLSTYGIEFVEDKRLGKFIPTCHRFVDKDIFENENYLAALANASEAQKETYVATAEKIAKLQSGIKAKLDSEEPYEVFISFKAEDSEGVATEDSVIARNIYDALTKKGIKTFFSSVTLENRIGDEYEPIIYRALYSCKFFILVATKEEYINAPWVKNEWSRFEDRIAEEGLSGSSAAVFRGISPYNLPRAFQTQGVSLEKHPFDYALILADNIENKIGHTSTSNYNINDKSTLANTNNEEARKAEELKKWEVGGTVSFGSYPQERCNPEPIEWYVLKREGNKALLISKCILDCVPFHKSKKEITWKSCYLRRWLNTKFFKKAFTASDRTIIQTTSVYTEKCKMSKGKYTIDKVFVLNCDEAKDFDRILSSGISSSPTTYAQAQTNYVIQSWWLRSPGNTQSDVAIVQGSSIGYYQTDTNSTSCGVRPAIWITLDI